MIDLAHQVPDLLPGVDMTAPCQRFVANAQVACPGALGQQAQVVEQNVPVTHRVRCGIAAHQHQVGAQFLHQVKLAFGSVQIAGKTVATATFKITKRLEQADFQPQIGAYLTHFTRAAVVIQQVIFKDFDPVKTCRRNGVELLRQGAAQGNRGDRTLHL